MPIHGNYSRDKIEIDEDGIIDNKFHKYIKEGQLYMKKEILQDVVNHIAIKENFQFKVKRSSSTRSKLGVRRGKILPLAFAVVDSENDASRKWFLERIRETYGTREKTQQKNLINTWLRLIGLTRESVNAADKEARDLPIYDLLDYLMKMIGHWNNTNRNGAIATGTTLSTKYEDLMREKMKESQGMTVTPST
ncbi:hypothetical protein H5410_064821 [Solanum commersonii]|uniref:Uncharacterized protein n=1 Tax=Solanum commersonii TaxID=4109 RepID=A0A9J5VYF8_SOLCO|nr:hypothetical protein H5410_064821 [Solanum commersonii]